MLLADNPGDASAMKDGSGKRTYIKSGRYDARYMMTVPGDLDAGHFRRQVDLLLRTIPSVAERAASLSKAARPSTCSFATCPGSRSTST